MPYAQQQPHRLSAPEGAVKVLSPSPAGRRPGSGGQEKQRRGLSAPSPCPSPGAGEGTFANPATGHGCMAEQIPDAAACRARTKQYQPLHGRRRGGRPICAVYQIVWLSESWHGCRYWGRHHQAGHTIIPRKKIRQRAALTHDCAAGTAGRQLNSTLKQQVRAPVAMQLISVTRVAGETRWAKIR